jgi:hypothetical protein
MPSDDQELGKTDHVPPPFWAAEMSDLYPEDEEPKPEPVKESAPPEGGTHPPPGEGWLYDHAKHHWHKAATGETHPGTPKQSNWASGGDDTTHYPPESIAHEEADYEKLGRIMGKADAVEHGVALLLKQAGPNGLRMRDLVKRLNKGGNVYGDISSGEIKAVLDSMEVSYKNDLVRLSSHDEQLKKSIEESAPPG